jgi:osmotically-inducible protein OsmY
MLIHPEIIHRFPQLVNKNNNWIHVLEVVNSDQAEIAGQSSDVQPLIKSAEHTVIKPELTKIVELALKANPYIDSSFIRVLALGSRITLSGKVKSWFQKEEAGRVAKMASGNLNIINDIAISYYA